MKPLVTDELWEKVEPLLPPAPSRRYRFPGRKPLDYRKIFTGILFVPKTGIAWDDLPADLSCGCGKTRRHYLRLWHQAGVWQKLRALLLAELHGADQIDWSGTLIDKEHRHWGVMTPSLPSSRGSCSPGGWANGVRKWRTHYVDEAVQQKVHRVNPVRSI